MPTPTFFFEDCRGTNVAPVYPSRWEEYNNLPNSNASWFGNNGPLATWRFYHSGDAKKELRYLRNIGMNSVRVWLHMDAWRANKDNFLSSIQDYAQALDEHNMYSNWVLFDNIGVDPLLMGAAGPGDYGPTVMDPSGMTNIYTRSPSTSALSSVAKVGEFLSGNPGEDGFTYVEQVVSALSGYQSTLLYDIFNEPARPNTTLFGVSLAVPLGANLNTLCTNEGPSGIDHFLSSTLWKVKQLDPHPTRKTTIGFASISTHSGIDLADSQFNPAVSSEWLDVLSKHEYVLLSSVREKVWEDQASISEIFTKPVILTEFVNPDFFITHNEAVDYYSRYVGLGCQAFCPTIGHPFSSEPFKLFGTGMLHYDGSMKDKVEASAFLARARAVSDFNSSQLPDHIALKEIQASAFNKDENLIRSLSGANTLFSIYQSIANAGVTYDARFWVSAMGYTNFVAYPGDPSSAYPLRTPFSQSYGIPDNAHLGRWAPGIKKLDRADIVSAVSGWIEYNKGQSTSAHTPLSGYDPTASYEEYEDLQREKTFQAQILVILDRDIKIVSDNIIQNGPHTGNLIGSVHERNYLSSATPAPTKAANARLLENSISGNFEVISNNGMLKNWMEVSTAASAASFDASFGTMIGLLASAIDILQEKL